jgi:hypothetical protein
VGISAVFGFVGIWVHVAVAIIIIWLAIHQLTGFTGLPVPFIIIEAIRGDVIAIFCEYFAILGTSILIFP